MEEIVSRHLRRSRSCGLALLAVAAACTSDRKAASDGTGNSRAPVVAERPADAPLPPAFTAVVLPTQAIDLVAYSQGVVTDVLVEPGAVVAANQIVARMTADDVSRDESEAYALAKQAEAEVQRATAELTGAQKKLEARTPIGVVSAEEKNLAEAAVSVAQANLEVAKQTQAQRQAQYAKAKYRAEQLVVRAPFAGVVSTRYITAGTHVVQGTRIVRFIGKGEPIVRFAVPNEAPIALGSRVTFVPSNATQQPRAPNMAVIRVSPEVDPHTGLVLVEGALDGTAAAEVRPGTTGRVTLAALTEVSPQ